jgi:hypothetical protein
MDIHSSYYAVKSPLPNETLLIKLSIQYWCYAPAHCSINNKKFWDELMAYFPLKWHGPHRKWRLQQFFYCCVCIRCRDNIFTEPLSSNDSRIHIQTHKLMGGIYEVSCWDGLRCNDVHTNFHKDWFSHSKINGGIHRHTDSMVIA